MQYGDKLYFVVDGILQSVTFIQEYKAPRATETTYIIRDAGRVCQVSKDMYYQTPRAAYIAYLDECNKVMAQFAKQLDEQQKQLQYICECQGRAARAMCECKE